MVRSEHHQHDHEEEHIQMVVSVVAIHHVEHKKHPEYGHFGAGSQKIGVVDSRSAYLSNMSNKSNANMFSVMSGGSLKSSRPASHATLMSREQVLKQG